MPAVSDDNPGIRIPPPFILLTFFLIGLALRPRFPVEIPYGMEVGIGLAVVALALIVWGIAAMLWARTTIMPHSPASALVTSGPFRFTRNPLYVSMVLGYLSAAFWIGVVPAIVLLPVALAVFHYFVIRREEAYLTRRFGDEYREYCRRVRRWL